MLLDSMEILTILIPPIHGHELSNLCYFQSLSSVSQFSVYRSFTLLVKLFLDIVFLISLSHSSLLVSRISKYMYIEFLSCNFTDS